jgi:hypothetical protein
MKKNGFNEGWVDYQAGLQADFDPAGLLAGNWDDGFLAFSRGERRLFDFLAENGSQPLARLQGQRVDGLTGVEGYLMELDLWRRDQETGCVEEIVAEREDRGFFVQTWRLETRPPEGCAPNCYFRPLASFSRKPIGDCPRIFPETALRAVEVIVADRRLHFFLTTAGR